MNLKKLIYHSGNIDRDARQRYNGWYDMKSNLAVNISSNSDKLHSFYGKAKYAFLAVFALTIMFASFVSYNAYGESVVGTVQTKLVLKVDEKTENVITTQNTIGGALTQNNVTMAKNDITEPPLDTYLSGKKQEVQIIRALPVLISDNGQSWASTTAYTQPTDILKQLAVEVFPEDKISAELILDPAVEGAVGQKVIIKRAPVYTIYVDDTTKIVRSWATNVGDLLNEKGIPLGINDIVEPAKTVSLTGVLEVVVTRINYVDAEETVPIVFQTIEQKDYNMYQGNSVVTQIGANGSKKQSVHLVYRNGVEVQRTVTATTVLETVQNKIVRVGVKPYGMDEYWPILVAASNIYAGTSRYDVSPDKMARVMLCESGGGQFADNGTNKGIFQWDGSLYTWAAKVGHPASNMFDIDAQIYATALRASQNGWGAWGQCRNR